MNVRLSPRRFVVALGVLASIVRPASADAQERLSLDQASYLARVEDDAPLLLASPERRAAWLAVRDVARRRPIPSLTAGLAQVDVSGEGAPTASLLAVDLPFELGGDRAARLAEADAAIALETATLALETRELLRTAALAYLDAVAAEATVRVREALAVEHRRSAALDAIRLERGEITRAQSLRTELERDRAELELQAARSALSVAELALGRFVVTEVPIAIAPAEELGLEHHRHDEASLLREAREHHPALRAAERQLALVRARRARVRAARVVDPTLRLEWQHNGATSEPQFRQRANDTLALLLNVPFPITAPRRAELAVADAEIAVAEARLLALERRVENELRVALATETEADERLHALDTTLRERARALVEATTEAYERDAATAFELAAARRALEEVELARVEAMAALARAHRVVLALASGAP